MKLDYRNPKTQGPIVRRWILSELQLGWIILAVIVALVAGYLVLNYRGD